MTEEYYHDHVLVAGDRFFARVEYDETPDTPDPVLLTRIVTRRKDRFIGDGECVDDLDEVEVGDDEVKYPLYSNGQVVKRMPFVTSPNYMWDRQVGWAIVTRSEGIDRKETTLYLEDYLENLSAYLSGEVFHIKLYDNESKPLWAPNEIVAHRPVIDYCAGFYRQEDAVQYARDMIERAEQEG